MKKEKLEYIENLRAIAGVSGNIVTFSDLSILRVKYKLTEKGWDNMIGYCDEHGIRICELNEKKYNNNDDEDELLVEFDEEPSDERKEREDLADIITERIMHCAFVRAEKRVNGRGRICGTYMRSVASTVNRKVKYLFGADDMKYIISHLPEKTEDEEAFDLQTEELKEDYKRSHLNKILNSLIPRLLIHRYYQDILT